MCCCLVATVSEIKEEEQSGAEPEFIKLFKKRQERLRKCGVYAVLLIETWSILNGEVHVAIKKHSNPV